MVIDIEPIIEQANAIDRIVLNMRQIDALYVVRLANGEDYTVKWDRQQLHDFLPNNTVSEVIKSWEMNIIDRYEVAVKALETKLHPVYTVDREILNPLTGISYNPKQYETVPKPLNRYEVAHFEHEVIELNRQFGQMSFIKIV